MRTSGLSWSDDREWLLTNGLGGYASSTLSCLNTRKYHGLLVAAFSPEDRRMLLSGIRDEVAFKGKPYRLHAEQHGSEVPDDGFYLASFDCAVLPRFAYKLPGLRLEKTIFMPQRLNAVVVEYRASEKAGLNADFLVTSRDHHWVLREPDWGFGFKGEKDIATLTPGHDDPPAICVGASRGSVTQGHGMVRGVHYRQERARGYEHMEDLFVGARLETELEKGESLFVVCSSDLSGSTAEGICRGILRAAGLFKEGEVKRLKDLAKRFYRRTGSPKSKNISRLVAASNDFLVDKDGETAVIAGYPWFGEWGRDSLISLPGLCLATGQEERAEEVLKNLLEQAEGGIIPNSFQGGKRLNSIDASLWLFWSVWKYLRQVRDYDFVRDSLWAGMKGIVKTYAGMAEDGLIKTTSSLPLTWMDAVVDGKPVTPRRGKAVEIQALWHNALMVSAKLAEEFGEDSGGYRELAGECEASFNKEFWNPGRDYLYDVVGETKDASLRPNALLAVSLPFPVLDKGRWKSVVDLAERELLTPYGLRTLGRGEPGYRGSAQGSQRERDLSYHQGDVWPWLLGPFIDAYRKVHPRRKTRRFFKTLIGEHLQDAGMGCVSEVFDGEPPHQPEGCVNQAWSVAELLRMLSETS